MATDVSILLVSFAKFNRKERFNNQKQSFFNSILGVAVVNSYGDRWYCPN